MQIQGNGIGHIDNKNPPKIDSTCEKRFTALEEENETLKMKIEILEKVNLWEEKNVHTLTLAICKKSLMSHVSFF